MGIIKTLKRKIFYIRNVLSNKKLIIKNKNLIITGSNSGIGLSLLNQLSTSNRILSFVNNNSNEVEKIIDDKNMVIKCDFNNLDNLQNFKEKIENFKANIVINCAATFGEEDKYIENIDLKNYQKVINVNSLSQFSIIQSCIKSNL